MSISRKNWSALSSLARQWTMEDEEEVEREKRRRVKSSADPDSDASETRRDTPTSDSIPETDSSSETSQGLNSVDQMQLDFVEMLRVRDEKRRIRHVETLRKQKEVGEDEGETCSGGARVELLGDLDVDEGSVFPPVQATKPQPPVKTTSYSPTNSNSNSRSSSTSTNITNRQHENGESTGKAPDPKPPSNPARKFVSSVSISLDRSPSVSGCTSPISPRSPKAPLSPGEHWPSPCQSPSSRDAQSPVQNGHTHEMMRKKEEETSPLQRSASVRMASKKFEPNTDQNDNEDSAPSLQRNSRQRISSRSIKEKMERLAQAAQKSDVVKSPDVTQRTLHLLDEVSRKRGLFEKEQQATAPTSPGVSRQEFRNFASGMSDRINRWLNKGDQTGSSHSPTDLRHVDITSMRSMFESRAEGSVPETTPAKIYK
ncbi:ladinin-1 isoform X2 [Notolabrus celidotus]|uniref:ladinin-1 isoform X2 n=1 Tax=Notolabrus celidotus TaxID=1203425 RepID=UPI0014905CB8|nr:ladinin-1 isoform X2 [Notolabrus celidotus]